MAARTTSSSEDLCADRIARHTHVYGLRTEPRKGNSADFNPGGITTIATCSAMTAVTTIASGTAGCAIIAARRLTRSTRATRATRATLTALTSIETTRDVIVQDQDRVRFHLDAVDFASVTSLTTISTRSPRPASVIRTTAAPSPAGTPVAAIAGMHVDNGVLLDRPARARDLGKDTAGRPPKTTGTTIPTIPTPGEELPTTTAVPPSTTSTTSTAPHVVDVI
jgi:hypothetical protein